ncbi:hypothetical protein T492DRAFT_536649 [Pavlovales sp. CCMP2436]|nr:hypothetical protein T492DRAFT_536649 [Pavlovales sp. CCMP2436]|mmetsp:Transcript_25769/g.65372  ORF Transcript_25769/g.65372 Transcript_25769/m.65372 type:complete len:282 (-) Transcript_25769:54-899(-)
MLASGASVIAVEPAADLARAANETAILNCWGNRSVFLNAFVDAEPWLGGLRSAHLGWRLGGRPPGLKHALPRAPGVTLEHVLTQVRVGPGEPPASQIPRHFDLVKMDGDGPEGSWLVALDRLLRNCSVTVGAIILEASNVQAATMHAYQNEHGFDVYRLDMHDDRRFINAAGWDEYAPARGTAARLDRLRSLPRDKFEEEMFSVRLMRHVFRAKRGLDVEGWSTLLTPIARFPVQLLLTRELEMLEPHAEHPLMSGDKMYAALAIERNEAMRIRSGGVLVA